MKEEKEIPTWPLNASGKSIVVKLDEHTYVTLRKKKSFRKWKKRFPDAKIISE